MGHIINPISFRLGYSRFWSSSYNSISLKNNSNLLLGLSLFLKEFTKNFFNNKKLKAAGILFSSNKIILQKNKAISLVFLQDYRIDQLLKDLFYHLKRFIKRSIRRSLYSRLHRIRKQRNEFVFFKKRLLYLIGLRKHKIFYLFRGIACRKIFYAGFFHWLLLKKFMYRGLDLYFSNAKSFEIYFFIWQDILRCQHLYKKYSRKRAVLYQIFNREFSFFLTPSFLGKYIIRKLKQRHKLRDVLKPVLRALGRNPGIIGFKICCSGRFTRAERATFIWERSGCLGTADRRAFLDYDLAPGTLRFGAVCIKIWISYRLFYLKELRNRIGFFFRLY
jgi:hypothetical protein